VKLTAVLNCSTLLLISVQAFSAAYSSASATGSNAESASSSTLQNAVNNSGGLLILLFFVCAGSTAAADDAASTSGRGTESSARSVWGAVVNFERVGKKDNTDGGDGESNKKRKEGPYIVDVLVNCASDSIPGTGPKRSVATLHLV